jgi:hypothetical protein
MQLVCTQACIIHGRALHIQMPWGLTGTLAYLSDISKVAQQLQQQQPQPQAMEQSGLQRQRRQHDGYIGAWTQALYNKRACRILAPRPCSVQLH